MFTACGMMHRRCCLLVTWSPADNIAGALYHKLQTQSSVPEDGRIYRPKHAELIEIINKLLLLHLVGVYIIVSVMHGYTNVKFEVSVRNTMLQAVTELRNL